MVKDVIQEVTETSENMSQITGFAGYIAMVSNKKRTNEIS